MSPVWGSDASPIDGPEVFVEGGRDAVCDECVREQDPSLHLVQSMAASIWAAVEVVKAGYVTAEEADGRLLEEFHRWVDWSKMLEVSAGASEGWGSSSQ